MIKDQLNLAADFNVSTSVGDTAAINDADQATEKYRQDTNAEKLKKLKSDHKHRDVFFSWLKTYVKWITFSIFGFIFVDALTIRCSAQDIIFYLDSTILIIGIVMLPLLINMSKLIKLKKTHFIIRGWHLKLFFCRRIFCKFYSSIVVFIAFRDSKLECKNPTILFDISNGVLIALLGTFFATAAGLMAIALKDLFSKEKPESEK
jgi:hypothetical protein